MNVIVLTLVGAVILLDKYAIGEFGFSQPIVTGAIIGALVGDIPSGIFFGAILQLIFLGESPFSGDIPPDGQAAGIIGCGSFFFLKISNSLGHAMFLAVILALSGSIIGGVLDMYTHRYNEKICQIFLREKKNLFVCHFAGLATAFIRGVCLLLPFFILARSISVPQSFPQLTKELLTIIALSAGLAHGIKLFIKKTTLVYFVCGVICGLVLLVF